jgi:hypothetical protein
MIEIGPSPREFHQIAGEFPLWKSLPNFSSFPKLQAQVETTGFHPYAIVPNAV